MAKSFREELFEVRDEVLGRVHADAPWEEKIRYVTRGIFEAVGSLIRIFDEKDQAADLAKFKKDVAAVIRDTADDLLIKNPIINGVLQSAAMPISSALVDAVAVQSQTVDNFIDNEITSRLAQWRDTLGYGVRMLEGEEPDPVGVDEEEHE
jgi:hypothetical protein